MKNVITPPHLFTVGLMLATEEAIDVHLLQLESFQYHITKNVQRREGGLSTRAKVLISHVFWLSAHSLESLWPPCQKSWLDDFDVMLAIEVILMTSRIWQKSWMLPEQF